MKRCIFAPFFLLVAMLTGCAASTSRASIVAVEYINYKDIPGVTAQEIEAIESMRSQNATFIFGMPEGAACFHRYDGALDGYSVLLSAWLSNLFGFDFLPVMYE